MADNELYRLTAMQAVRRLRDKQLTPLDLVEAAAARIEAVDGNLNAMPTHCFERAREHAKSLMKASAESRPAGWLGGLPIAVKDLVDVAGVRTTYGSPIYANHVPQRSDLLVERLEANGAIVIGKSNTPEFGAGASTFNEVFGKTRNPWNGAKSVSGSSGGSAAALASGQVWLATGSDLGGSLRLPASFNAVLGLRPSPGCVARGPELLPFATLSVEGPMARSAEDLALMLDAMSGTHPLDPLAVAAPARSYLQQVGEMPPPRRIGFSADLGFGVLNPEVGNICERAAATLAGACNAELVGDAPDLDGAQDCFQTLRAAQYAANHREKLAEHRELLKPEVIWNIEKGLALTAAEIGAAEHRRARLVQATGEFFQRCDLLVCPVAIVPPFDVDVRYVEQVGKHRFDNYIDWMTVTYVISLLGCPALSAPGGFTTDGLPVGLQIVAPPRHEARAIAAAQILETATGIAQQLPIDPR
ncbi:MAG: amidase family protein [Gammaproteobacteria bacterium]|nr:amidase family protein [Gammaproteobacteria bacterium]